MNLKYLNKALKISSGVDLANEMVKRLKEQKFEMYTFFWQSKSIYSQWYISEFKDNDGNVYNCAEQYMMAKKAQLFADRDTFLEIMAEKEPRNHKALGRKISNFHSPTWDEWKCSIVYDGNFLKFTQNPVLLAKLRALPESTLLVEASPYDFVCGIGMNEADAKKHLMETNNNPTWKGENLLGYVLTILKNLIK